MFLCTTVKISEFVADVYLASNKLVQNNIIWNNIHEKLYVRYFLRTSEYSNRFTVEHSGFLSNLLTLPTVCIPVMMVQL